DEIDAQNYINEFLSKKFSIDAIGFAKLVKDYIDKKDGNHHVVFLADEVGEYKKAAIHQGATIAIADMATALVNIGGQMLLLGLCAYLYLQGRIAFGAVITTGQFSSTIMNGVAAFVAQWNLIKSAKGLNEEILELEQQVEIPKDQHDDQKIAKIEIKDLTLQFKNGEKISYPNLTFNKGEKILITGDSGSGKSTLFKLILNKLTPSKGTIRFIDQDGKEVYLNPDEIGYLEQDSTLFPDTLENNITMFNAE
ncbi:ATP-binding cassette domain-containing protein, partial [Lactobacillus crispatus]|uniref:ATP-binding cassette domain-containing protein n=1 Tax=Lactobacillus crispatus TaxID=47770 RepID=UPI0021536623